MATAKALIVGASYVPRTITDPASATVGIGRASQSQGHPNSQTKNSLLHRTSLSCAFIETCCWIRATRELQMYRVDFGYSKARAGHLHEEFSDDAYAFPVTRMSVTGLRICSGHYRTNKSWKDDFESYGLLATARKSTIAPKIRRPLSHCAQKLSLYP